MTAFGDHEPEDAYCPTDAPAVIARNLDRRLEQLGAERRAGADATLAELLADLSDRVTELTVRRTGGERLELAAGDLAALAERLRDG
jgi:hypothetical protein